LDPKWELTRSKEPDPVHQSSPPGHNLHFALKFHNTEFTKEIIMKRIIYPFFLILVACMIVAITGLTPQILVRGEAADPNLYLPIVLKNYPVITKIAFLSERDGNREIYVIDSDGSNLTRLTDNSADDSDQSWSPDGTQIAYASQQDGNSEIYKVSADGSNPTRLTDNSSYESSPAWSPDGQKIAFRTDRHGSSNYEIYVINSDGTGERRVTDNATSDNYPTWSPDGNQIAFVGGGEVYIINANGTGQMKITSTSDAYAYDIDWSPDGSQIVFRGEVGSNQEIFVVNVNGTGLTDLTDDPGVDLTPKWSPDGTKIAYACNFKLCVMNPDGSDVTEVTDNAGQYPSWSPDGRHIAFSSDRAGNPEIYTIALNGTGLTRLTNDVADDWRPAWQP
jgi:Tol biopolymer transport system component